jgi:hypothetical protein
VDDHRRRHPHDAWATSPGRRSRRQARASTSTPDAGRDRLLKGSRRSTRARPLDLSPGSTPARGPRHRPQRPPQTRSSASKRIGFVAAAATILIAAHRELEKLVLTKRQRDFKDRAGGYYGDLLHEGLYLDPVCRDLERLLESSQERVSGAARVRLRRLGCDVLGVRSPHALSVTGARYGEGSSLWDGRDAEGFAKIYGIAARLAEENR